MKSLQELGDRHRGHAAATAARPKAGGAGSLRQGDQLSRLAVMRVGSARGRGSGESGQETEQGTEVKLRHATEAARGPGCPTEGPPRLPPTPLGSCGGGHSPYSCLSC